MATVAGMAIKLTVRKVGNSLGVILPKSVLAHLKTEEGQSLCPTRSLDGFHLTSEFSKQMAVVESLSRRYRNALHELAD